MMCREEANTKFAALILYFQEVPRKPTVITRTAALSVEVLRQELLKNTGVSITREQLKVNITLRVLPIFRRNIPLNYIILYQTHSSRWSSRNVLHVCSEIRT
jgi:hypothetical protein